jgi:hypothetical protein
MLGEVFATHSVLVQVFLWFLVGALFVPMVIRNNALGFRKANFIFTLVYQALATMIAFSGLVLYVLSDMTFSGLMIFMVVVWALLMFIEIKKYKVIKVAKVEKPEVYRTVKGLFYKITAVQIFLIVVTVVITILVKKGMIAL